LTTLEMLDAVEAGIAALRSRRIAGPQPQASAEAAAALRAELRAAGVSAHEFARVACVSQDDVEAWTAGSSRAPEWVPAAIRLLALLTPSMRHKLLHDQANGRASRANRHPFSRIEEL
jgi:DNA-binding transcriptional regulator YiaG